MTEREVGGRGKSDRKVHSERQQEREGCKEREKRGQRKVSEII